MVSSIKKEDIITLAAMISGLPQHSHPSPFSQKMKEKKEKYYSSKYVKQNDSFVHD